MAKGNAISSWEKLQCRFEVRSLSSISPIVLFAVMTGSLAAADKAEDDGPLARRIAGRAARILKQSRRGAASAGGKNSGRGRKRALEPRPAPHGEKPAIAEQDLKVVLSTA